MPEDRLVVSNTSPLLNLALIDRLDLLEDQLSTVLVPEQVWTELEEGDAGLESLRASRDRGSLDVVPVEPDDLYVEGRKPARRHGLSVS